MLFRHKKKNIIKLKKYGFRSKEECVNLFISIRKIFRGKCLKFIENLFLTKTFVKIDSQFSKAFRIKKKVFIKVVLFQ